MSLRLLERKFTSRNERTSEREREREKEREKERTKIGFPVPFSGNCDAVVTTTVTAVATLFFFSQPPSVFLSVIRLYLMLRERERERERENGKSKTAIQLPNWHGLPVEKKCTWYRVCSTDCAVCMWKI